MKFFISLLLIGLISYAAFLFANETPWWMFAAGAFIAGISIRQKAYAAFFAGFLSVFLLWAFLTWQMNTANEGLFATKMATILPLGGSENLLILVSATIGGITAGLAAATGSFLRKKV
jgi:hypothetical protein